MKKNVTLFLAAVCMAFQVNAQWRYTTEVFTDAEIDVQSNVPYGVNFNPYVDPAMLGGQTQMQPLMCDIYAPSFNVDTDSNRPVVVYFHTGSFLPPSVSGGCVGTKEDPTVEYMCRKLARHGFVVVSATYRLGWLANSTDLDLRRGTNLLAVYYSIQDAKTAVRYLNATKLGLGNPYGIDPSKTILMGQGSGGYITFGYASIDDYDEVANPVKFQYQGSTGILGQPVSPGDPYIDTALFGDWDGYGGAATVIGQNPVGLPIIDTNDYGRNYINHPGLPDNVLMVANMGGALGDSAWIEAGDVPMVSVHSKFDFFAPYEEGMVQVPVGNQFFPVVYVNGSHWAVTRANALGNNDIFLNAGYTDPLWQKGINNIYNTNKAPGIYTINIKPANAQKPWEVNNAPWDFWSDTTCTSTGNPNKEYFSQLYIDTVFQYIYPRMLTVLKASGLPIGVEEVALNNGNVKLYPNPANGTFTIQLNNVDAVLESVTILDITGKAVLSKSLNSTNEEKVDINNLSAGMYLVKVKTDKGENIQKLSIK